MTTFESLLDARLKVRAEALADSLFRRLEDVQCAMRDTLNADTLPPEVTDAFTLIKEKVRPQLIEAIHASHAAQLARRLADTVAYTEQL